MIFSQVRPVSSGHGWRVQTQFMVLSKHAGLEMQGGKGKGS